MKVDKVRLGDAATFINGFAFKPTQWSTKGKEIIRIQNLTGSSSDVNYFNGVIDDKYLVKRGDLLVSWSATLGVYEWQRADAVLNQHIFKVQLDKRKIDKKFFKYLLKSKLNDLEGQVHGATMKHITKKKFDDVIISLPPLVAQKDIATILENADSLIGKDQQLLQKYDNLMQSIFYDMFGDPFKNQRNWPTKNLGDVCHTIKDGPHVSPKYTQEGMPFISVNNIINGFWDLRNVKYISNEDYEVYKKRCNPEFGDVLYTKGGTTGFAKYIDINLKFINWVHLAVLKYDRDILNGRFLEAMLNTSFCYHQSQRLTRGIANRDLVLGEMKKINLFLPPLRLQEIFCERMEGILSQKVKVETACILSDRLFATLMNQFFS
jgi:type I restriction enzyme, S subunit